MTPLAIWILRLYQVTVSPLLPPNTCRFHPTCSHYAMDAIGKYGLFQGLLRAVRRIMKCHPFHPGGYDPA